MLRREQNRVNNILTAAVCQAGGLPNLDAQFDDQTLQVAHDEFGGRISLAQLIAECAEANGHISRGGVDAEMLRAAWGPIYASGFSTTSLSNVLSNTANKFITMGFDSVDMTCRRISRVRPVRDFKTATSISLHGGHNFEKLGPGGEIKHGVPGETVYTNSVSTYARMLAITRQDVINDDLGVLTMLPQKLGRGAGLALNERFWTVFLDNSSFFSSANSNLNEGVATVTSAGLTATEVIFRNQVDPDGHVLGVMPSVMLVPPTQHSAALELMNSERVIDGTSTAKGPDGNIWRGRFRVETSPYMENSSYTGNSTAYWYLLADPQNYPVIEIAALNGNLEVTVESADADFNMLGIQMRGFSDFGVAMYEKRYGVKADGGAS